MSISYMVGILDELCELCVGDLELVHIEVREVHLTSWSLSVMVKYWCVSTHGKHSTYRSNTLAVLELTKRTSNIRYLLSYYCTVALE